MNRTRKYAVSFEIQAPPHEATKLRTLLRDTLELGGYEVTAGATIIESALLEAVAALSSQDAMRAPASASEAEHHAKDGR